MTGFTNQDGLGQAELPTPNSTRSYWHRDPSKKLLGHRTSEDLPSTTDVVVVGSGITGAFAARELVTGGRGVVMLESREACWGATGRNGGHCQPAIWNSQPEISRFELATFEMIKDLAAKHNIPCDFHVVGGVHAIFSQQLLDAAEKQIERLQKYPDLRDKAFLIRDKDELAAKQIPGAVGAVYQPNAAKCWPYKLVAWVLEQLLNDYDVTSFNLQTNTSVTRLEKNGASWIVHTERGQIHAQNVLLASNAYTSYLLPKMTGLILPVRGQVCALQPPPEAAQLPHSYVWLKGADHEYLIHRGPEDTQVEGGGGLPPVSVDRSLILGGERESAPGQEEGVSRDDTINPIVSRELHRRLTDAIDLVPGDKSRTGKESLSSTYEWTGIMGFSSDENPWVGRVPKTLVDNPETDADVTGLWISAGYTGHGMPVAARCGIAVAESILGKQDGVQVPKDWVASDERVEKARTTGPILTRTLDDVIKLLPTE